MAQFQYEPFVIPPLYGTAVDTADVDIPRDHRPANPVLLPVAAYTVLFASFFAPVYIPDVTDPPPTPLAATVRIPDEQLRPAQPPTPHDLGWVGPILVPGREEPFLAGQSTGPDWLRLAPPPPTFPEYFAPVFIADVTTPTPDLSWAGEQPTWIVHAVPPTPSDIGGLTALQPPSVEFWYGSWPDNPTLLSYPTALYHKATAGASVVVPPETNKSAFGGGIPQGVGILQYQAVVTSLFVEEVTIDKWLGGPPLRPPNPLLPPTEFAAPIFITDVTSPAPALSWEPEYPDWIARPQPVPAFPDLATPIETPGVQAPFLSWKGTGPDFLRLALSLTPADSGLFWPPYVPDVTEPVTPLSWNGVYPDWLRLATPPTPADTGHFGPSFVPDVTTAAFPLSWRGEQPARVWGWPPLTPADTGWQGPIFIADVTTPTPDLSWGPSYPDLLFPPAQPVRTGGGEFDPFPIPPPTDLVWYGSAPDLPIRLPFPLAVYLRPGVGVGAVVPPETNKAGFGGGIPQATLAIQYRGLVVPLFIPVAPDLIGQASTILPIPAARLPLATEITYPWGPSRTDDFPQRQWQPEGYRHPQWAVLPTWPAFFFDPFPIPPVPAPDLPHAGTAVVIRRPASPTEAFFVRPVDRPEIVPIPFDNTIAGPGPLRPRARYQYPDVFAEYFVTPDVPVPPALPFPGRLPEYRFAQPWQPAWLGWVVGPIRVADVTVATPDLSWKGEQPDWIASREGPRLGWYAFSFSTVIPGLDESKFGWRGSYPDFLLRAAQETAGLPAIVLVSPSVFPIPELSWKAEYPDVLFSAGRVPAFPELAWEPFARPNDPSPDLAWEPEYPDLLVPPPSVIDRGGMVREPRMTPFSPDFVGGLASYPDWLVYRSLLTGSQRTWSDRFEIVIPDLRRDWAPVYPDRFPPRHVLRQSATSWAAEGDRAVSPTDFYSGGYERQPILPRLRWSVEVPPPPPGALILIGQQLAWRPDLPVVVPGRIVLPGGAILVLPPDIIAGSVGCVELSNGQVTSPMLLAAVVTTPTLLDGEVTTPDLSAGEVC